jgi:HK97 gp10 family phage protein
VKKLPSTGLQLVIDTVTPRLVGWTARLQNEIAQELDVVGANMLDLARSVVPVRTGFLQSTIYYSVTVEDMTVELGATAEYASYVEYGTQYMSPRPYLRPAVDGLADQFSDAIMTAVQNAWNNV